MNILFQPMKFVKETFYANDLNEEKFAGNSTKKNNLNGNEIKQFYESLISESPSSSNSETVNESYDRPIIRIQSNRKEKSGNNKTAYDRQNSKKLKNSDLLKATTNGSLTETKRCLNVGTIDVNCSDEFRWTPLMCAAFAGFYDVVEYLLLNGAEIERKNLKQETARDLAVKNGFSDICRLIDRYSLKLNSIHDNSEYEFCEKNSKTKWICEQCQRQFSDDPTLHLSSTVHLLNATGEREQRDCPCFLINQSNAGYRLMVKEGWDERSGLGLDNKGRKYPIKTFLKRDRLGFGVKTSEKPRVTHFEPFDTSSIRCRLEQQRPTAANGGSLKSRLKRNSAKHKELETSFRREFYLNG